MIHAYRAESLAILFPFSPSIATAKYAPKSCFVSIRQVKVQVSSKIPKLSFTSHLVASPSSLGVQIAHFQDIHKILHNPEYTT